MAGILKSIFRSKKSKKEDEKNEELARDISNRRSFRAGSTQGKSSRRMTTRFEDDGMLSATAAYHTNNAPKMRKGPQSCPGGNYRGESDASFESDKFSAKSGRSRRGDALNQSMRHNYTIDDDRNVTQKGRRHNKYGDDFRRGRNYTSEYGSGDPSPIGNFSSNRHSHYDEQLEDSENDDFDDKEQMAMMERTSRHYFQKFKESETRRREERRDLKKQLKDSEKGREESHNSMMAFMRQSEQERKEKEQMKKERDQARKEKDRYKAKCRQLESQLSEFQQMHPTNNAFSQLSFNQQYGGYGNLSMQQHRSPFMGALLSDTPTTMNSHMTNGAGEALVQPADMSHLQFHGNNLAPLPMLSPFQGTSHNYDDGVDETKNFRDELQIETARTNNKDQNEPLCLSSSESTGTILENSLAENKENMENVNVKPLQRNNNGAARSSSIMTI